MILRCHLRDSATPASAQASVIAPFAGVVVSIARQPGEQVGSGAPLVVLEAMKMEHEVLSEIAGVVSSVEVSVGEAVDEGQVLVLLGASQGADGDRSDGSCQPDATPADGFRADLEAVRERHAVGLDACAPGGRRSPARARTAHRARESR